MEYQHQVLEFFSRMVRAVAGKGFILLVVAELRSLQAVWEVQLADEQRNINFLSYLGCC